MTCSITRATWAAPRTLTTKLHTQFAKTFFPLHPIFSSPPLRRTRNQSWIRPGYNQTPYDDSCVVRDGESTMWHRTIRRNWGEREAGCDGIRRRKIRLQGTPMSGSISHGDERSRRGGHCITDGAVLICDGIGQHRRRYGRPGII